MVRRDGQLLHIRGSTTLQAGDELLVQIDPDNDLRHLFRAAPAD